MFQFSSIKKNLDSLLAAAAGFTIILLLTKHGGIGIEPDSVVYLTTAENLHASGRLDDFSNNPLVDFPAFYPIFLSSFMWLTGSNPLAFAPVLNALLFAFLIYMSGYIMEQFSYRSRWYKVAVLSCIVISPCLMEVYSMLMSETIFLVLLLLFMIAMHRYLQTHSQKALIAAALLAALASVTRYAGITIIAAGVLLLVLDATLPLQKRIKNGLLYSATSPLLLIINLARNYSVSDTATGGRERSVTSLRENMHDAGSVIYDWLPFLHGHYTGAGIAIGFLILILAWTCVRQFRKRRRPASFEDMAAFFSLLYLLFMIIVASVSRFETLNSRFLSPIFILLIWAFSSRLPLLIQKITSPKKKWMTAIGIIVFLGFQYGQLATDYETWDGVKDAGIPGYTEDQWRYSETVQFIEKDSLLFQPGYTIYSDANDAIYFFTGRQGKFLPHKQYIAGVEEFLSDHHCYVVWFDDGENPDLVDKNFIVNTKKMKLVKQFSDGTIYGYDN